MKHTFTDLIAELSWDLCLHWIVDTAPVVAPWTYIDLFFFVQNRDAAPQNQEGTGCSGEAEGVRRYPPSLWQGDEPPRISILTVADTCGFSAVNDALLPYLPCLSINLEMKSSLRHAVLAMFGLCISFYIWLWNLFNRGSAWLSQPLLRLCVWSPAARWATCLIKSKWH